MNIFFKYVQPTIIKTSDDEALREDLRNQYMVNFNVFGIDYFEDTYILNEDDSGNAFYFTTEDDVDNTNSSESSDDSLNDAYHIDLESSNTVKVIDLPRIYVQITDNFINDKTRIFQKFIVRAVENPELFVTGIDNFKAGVDYYINKTLFDYLYKNDIVTYDNSLEYILPNYLDGTDGIVTITKYWVDRTGDDDEDYTNLSYYMNKNYISHTYHFTEDELNAFCSTFCNIILNDSLISDNQRAELQNQIYELALKYWGNYGTDDASIAINLILNSLYSTTTNTTCGCNTSLTSEDTTTTTSCYDLYKEAMQTYLTQMLGDVNFYKDWMSIIINDCTTVPNEALIDLLIMLLNEFISLGYDLSFSTSANNCMCPDVDTATSDCNYRILNNYLKVLEWVKNGQIDANTNKIKIYGGQFGELLPKLQF